MSTRTNPLHEANRLAAWQLAEIGREIHQARIMGGHTQAIVARRVGTSTARISRVERGMVSTITYRQLARLGGAVGLKLYLRAFPATRRLLDQPQLDLFAELRRRSHSAWIWESEVPMPIAGDLRAADARATIPGCAAVFELWTRLADVQGQTRSATLKARDLGADRLIVVVKATRANREALRQAGPTLQDSFPLGSCAVLRALADGRDPGANGILLL